ncbi:hypothetical protein C8R44DRAFT_820178, partial [Mycena epipterygia]
LLHLESQRRGSQEVAIRVVELGLNILQRMFVAVEVHHTRVAAGQRDFLHTFSDFDEERVETLDTLTHRLGDGWGGTDCSRDDVEDFLRPQCDGAGIGLGMLRALGNFQKRDDASYSALERRERIRGFLQSGDGCPEYVGEGAGGWGVRLGAGARGLPLCP